MAVDIHRLVGSLATARTSLSLDATDLAFLIFLQARADVQMLPSFEEELLYDVYAQACDATEVGATNPRTKATNAIARLRDQRLLGRVDGAGVLRNGEYTLSQLATGIVGFFLQDQALTRESLTLLTKSLISQLSAIKAQAASARSQEEWRTLVVQPLRVTVADLVSGIERRQRGLDGQQEEIRREISELLRRDWFESVESCERLLGESTATLRELNEVLMQDEIILQTLLGEIERLAMEAGATESEEAARRVAEQVGRVAAWGSDRQRAWSDYFQFVQRYLRTVVRLDPDRALSQRLRDQVRDWPHHPFSLCRSLDEPLRVLREASNRVIGKPVARPLEERERPLEMDNPVLEEMPLATLIRRARADGACSLTEVLEAVLPTQPPEQRYRAVGRVAALLGDEATPPLEKQWCPASEILIEEWPLR